MFFFLRRNAPCLPPGFFSFWCNAWSSWYLFNFRRRASLFFFFFFRETWNCSSLRFCFCWWFSGERELLQDYNNNFFLLSLNGATITIKHVIFVLFKWRQSVASGGLFCFRTALKFRRRCALCWCGFVAINCFVALKRFAVSVFGCVIK